jgi:hypothetical protein
VITCDGGLCQVRGPRCTTVATTAHHILPSSQYPELFFDPSNLEASCRRCNDHGAVVKAENRVNRMTIAHLEDVIEEQRAEIERLAGELARYKNGEYGWQQRAEPQIY